VWESQLGEGLAGATGKTPNKTGGGFVHIAQVAQKKLADSLEVE